jgi:hypothetical protein
MSAPEVRFVKFRFDLDSICQHNHNAALTLQVILYRHDGMVRHLPTAHEMNREGGLEKLSPDEEDMPQQYEGLEFPLEYKEIVDELGGLLSLDSVGKAARFLEEQGFITTRHARRTVCKTKWFLVNIDKVKTLCSSYVADNFVPTRKTVLPNTENRVHEDFSQHGKPCSITTEEEVLLKREELVLKNKVPKVFFDAEGPVDLLADETPSPETSLSPVSEEIVLPATAKPKIGKTDLTRRVIALWNEILTAHGIKSCQAQTNKSRVDALVPLVMQRYDDVEGDVTQFKVVFDKVAESDFLQKKWGKATLGWILTASKFNRALEGGYDNLDKTITDKEELAAMLKRKYIPADKRFWDGVVDDHLIHGPDTPELRQMNAELLADRAKPKMTKEELLAIEKAAKEKADADWAIFLKESGIDLEHPKNIYP